MTFILRPYQQETVSAIWNYLQTKTGNGIFIMPVGSGKTPVMATLIKEACEKWPGTRILVLASVRELLQQARDKILAVWPEAPIGLYSAGLKARESSAQVLVAGIQSVYNKAKLVGHVDLILADECHGWSDDAASRYRVLLADLKAINPNIRLIGCTATAWRLGDGVIYGPDKLFTDVCHEVKIRPLIDQGFLCNLRGKCGSSIDTSELHVRAGDYLTEEVESKSCDEKTVSLACDEIVKYLTGRKSWLVFAISVKHATMVRDALRRRMINAEMVVGETGGTDRARIIDEFKSGAITAIVNVGCLTTGFDHSGIDAIVLLRPTLSSSLLVQMVGRGLRINPEKKDCTVLDLASCFATHGPIDQITPHTTGTKNDFKICPQCAEIVELGVMVCAACGFEYPVIPVVERVVANHDTKAADVDPLARPQKTVDVWTVDEIQYDVWTKKGAPPNHPKTLRVTYYAGYATVSEWICFEHQGYAHGLAREWWSKRSIASMPKTSADALAFIVEKSNAFVEPTHVRVKLGGKYAELIDPVFAGPCSSCKFFDEGYCHRHDGDVPDEFQVSGCADWKSVVDTQSSSTTTYGDTTPTVEETPF